MQSAEGRGWLLMAALLEMLACCFVLRVVLEQRNSGCT
jgi:uncharacterized membrane protein